MCVNNLRSKVNTETSFLVAATISYHRKSVSLDVYAVWKEMAAAIRIHHRHVLLLSPKADTHFTIPRRVEG